MENVPLRRMYLSLLTQTLFILVHCNEKASQKTYSFQWVQPLNSWLKIVIIWEKNFQLSITSLRTAFFIMKTRICHAPWIWNLKQLQRATFKKAATNGKPRKKNFLQIMQSFFTNISSLLFTNVDFPIEVNVCSPFLFVFFLKFGFSPKHA